MIWFALTILVAIGLFIWYAKDELLPGKYGYYRTYPGDWGWAIAVTLFCTAFAMLLVGVLQLGVGTLVTDYDELRPHHEFEIIAAADGSLTEGHFFIFSGYIDEEPTYFFYRQNADGGIRQGHIPVKNTTIYEDQPEGEGYIEVSEQEQSTSWVLYFPKMGGKSHEIHVPEGSVQRQFNFDLEK